MNIKQHMMKKYNISDEDWEIIEFEILNDNNDLAEEQSTFQEYKHIEINDIKRIISMVDSVKHFMCKRIFLDNYYN